MKILSDFPWPDISTAHLSALMQRYGWGDAMPNGIVMSDGCSLSAEDVLEGHFSRLSRLAQQSVVVQTPAQTDLSVAIAALAPDLEPLVDLAEDVAEAVPPASPSAQFRMDLHRALEQTHQQQAAARRLRPEAESLASPSLVERIAAKPTWAAGIPLLIGLLVCVFLYQKDARSVVFVFNSQSAQSS